MHEPLRLEAPLRKDVWKQIELDLHRTFPDLPSFRRKQRALGEVLRSYAHAHPEVGYCQSMNYIAGLLLVVLDDLQVAYRAFLVFMQVFGMSGLYLEGFPRMLLYSFATLRSVKQRMPQLHDHLWDMNVRFPKMPVNVSCLSVTLGTT